MIIDNGARFYYVHDSGVLAGQEVYFELPSFQETLPVMRTREYDVFLATGGVGGCDVISARFVEISKSQTSIVLAAQFR